jgi:8-oxo-dGTP pyrophosphatase MutT (NUDIX family)
MADEVKRAAGVIVRAGDGTMLFLRRGTGSDHAGEWGLPGGGIDGDEAPEAAARRELSEEAGFAADGDFRLLDHHVMAAVDFTTFVHDTADAFTPTLNDEHTEFVWARPDAAPQPLHPGLASTLALIGAGKRAMDRLAFDRASVRRMDQDGRLRVEITNISKAVVNPYQGKEIPDCEALGLDPEKVYQLLRDPGRTRQGGSHLQRGPSAEHARRVDGMGSPVRQGRRHDRHRCGIRGAVPEELPDRLDGGSHRGDRIGRAARALVQLPIPGRHDARNV